MTFKEIHLRETETSSADIAPVDTKINLIKRPLNKECKTHKEIDCVLCNKEIEEKKLQEAKTADNAELIRKAGFKIKDIIVTKFGTQIDILNFTKEDTEELENILKDQKFTISGKSIFIYS